MRAAVVGMGVIGKVHADIIKARGDELVAVCDVEKEKLTAYAGNGYTDYRELIGREKLDAIHICTPHYLHAEMIVAALDAGINVLAEKPLCIRREEIPEILRAEARSRAQLGVCLQNRYNPATAYAKKYLEGKRILGAAGTVAWHRDEAYYRSAEWRGKQSTEGGGVLINQALHTLDLLEWLVGTPKYVSAEISNISLRGKIEVEDTATLVCSGGAEFCLFDTNGSAVDFPVSICIKTQDETVTLTPDSVSVNGRTLSFPSGPRIGKSCYGSGHRALIADFYDCIRKGVRFPIGGEEGAKSIRLILAAYKSKGEQIEING